MTAFDSTAARAGRRLSTPPTLPSIPPGYTLTADRLWQNYQYFLKVVLPVAEFVGVRLALHPDDPPVPEVGGLPRIFGRVDAFKRAAELAGNSPAWGLELCLGCCSEMGGESTVLEMIRHFGPRGQIVYVHFRDVQGVAEHFQECFLGEGNYDPAKVLYELVQAGFDGFILDDHVPRLVGDTPWGHRARAHAIGYLQGMLRMLDYLSTHGGTA